MAVKVHWQKFGRVAVVVQVVFVRRQEAGGAGVEPQVVIRGAGQAVGSERVAESRVGADVAESAERAVSAKKVQLTHSMKKDRAQAAPPSPLSASTYSRGPTIHTSTLADPAVFAVMVLFPMVTGE